MEEGEIEGFIFKQLENEKELAKKIVKSIKSNKSEYIQSFLTNPLLLSLYILTFQSNSSIPNKKYIFYRRVIQALFAEHDSKTKLGFTREKLSGLKQEEFEDILKIYCFLTYFEGRFDWDLDYIFQKFTKIKNTKELKFDNNKVVKDFKSAIAIWVEDNGQYSFAHRSLQEYFAALFVKHLNIEGNKRIYTKIIDRFSNVKRLSEIENFLSLLEEMDTLNFKRYYYLPLLNELKRIIDDKDDFSLYSSFLKFLVKGIIISDSHRYYPPIIINEEIIYRTIYIHLPFTQKLYSLLESRRNIRKNKASIYIKQGIRGNDKYIIQDGDKKHTVEYINFTKEIPDSFNNVFFKPVLDIAKEFNLFIYQKIEETEKYIKKTIDIDKDFVDLI